MTSTTFRCSDAARERGDPMGGTSAPARVWLLIEYYSGWDTEAFDGSGIDEQVKRRLTEAVIAVGGRILLIRRPGKVDRRRGAVRSWAVANGHAPHERPVWGTWQQDEDLLVALEPLGRLSRAGEDNDWWVHGAASTRHTASLEDSLLLVCAHGRHDVCCAVRGRPVAAELARHWPEQTWECSHVGGDRFAPNVVMVPDGVYYGGLDPHSAPDVVRSHFGVGPLARYLRGISGLTPVTQVALIRAHETYGPVPWDHIIAVARTEVARGRWQVRLRGHGHVPQELVATVERTSQPPAQLTCRSGQQASATVFVVTELSVVSPS